MSARDVPSLEEKVAFLSRGDSYPGSPSQVDVIETHMSWVFLTPAEVYKLKKPIRLHFLDFTTLASRQRNCEAETHLNRRLADGVYFDPLTLRCDNRGRLSLRGKGDVCDWLVHMRRLPENRMLDTMIRQRNVQQDALERAAERLADFYTRAPVAEYTPDEYRRRGLERVQENREVLSDARYLLPLHRLRRVHKVQRDFLNESAGLFDSRVKEGRIVEAHGDLRPEHVCLTDPPVVIDCLEFNRDFRLLDPIDELAFLSIECEMQGAPEVGETFFRVYRERSGDSPPDALVVFYQCYRACLRAKLAAWHLDDDPQQRRRNWLAITRSYLHRAEYYAGLLL